MKRNIWLFWVSNGINRAIMFRIIEMNFVILSTIILIILIGTLNHSFAQVENDKVKIESEEILENNVNLIIEKNSTK